MQLKFKRGDNSKISTASANAPEQIWILFRTHIYDSALRCNYLRRNQVVASQPEPAVKPAVAASQSDPGNPPIRSHSHCCGKSKNLRFSVKLAESHSGLRPRRASHRIHMDSFHRGEVNQQPIVAQAFTCDALAASPHRYDQAVLTRKFHAPNDIRCTQAADNQRWMSVDHPVPHFPSHIV